MATPAAATPASGASERRVLLPGDTVPLEGDGSTAVRVGPGLRQRQRQQQQLLLEAFRVGVLRQRAAKPSDAYWLDSSHKHVRWGGVGSRGGEWRGVVGAHAEPVDVLAELSLLLVARLGLLEVDPSVWLVVGMRWFQ